MITNIEDELGYITAYRDFKDKRTNKARVAGYSFLFSYHVACVAFAFGVNPASYYGMFDSTMKIRNEIQKKTVVVLSNVLVEPYGAKTKVRVSFVEKVLVHADGYSYYRPAIRSARRIYSQQVYNNFFAQVAQSLYLADNKL
jgi:hypothetical protein